MAVLKPESARAVGHRLRVARERLGWDRPTLASRLGVHPGSIARWETGGSTPQPYHLDRLAEWAGTTSEWLLSGGGAAPAVGAPGRTRRAQQHPMGDSAAATGEDSAEGAVVDLFGSFDGVVRFLDGIAPPGQARARKLDALEGLRRMLTARGALPDWWYRLRDRVENDEL